MNKLCPICNSTYTIIQSGTGWHHRKYCYVCIPIRATGAQRVRGGRSTLEGHLKELCKKVDYRVYGKTVKKEKVSAIRNLELSDLLFIYNKQTGKCAISGETLTWTKGQGRVDTNISVDRIDSEKGYVKDNIQLVCWVVNSMKNNLTNENFIFWCDKILSNNLKIEKVA